MKPNSRRASRLLWPCALALALAAFVTCLNLAQKYACDGARAGCALSQAPEIGLSTIAFAGVEGEGASAPDPAAAPGALVAAHLAGRRRSCWSLLLQKTRLDV